MPDLTCHSRLSMFTVAAAALVMCGCGLDLAGGNTLEQQSVLTIFSPPDPAQAARWAADPYDPDKRQRGTLLLATAPWGGEPAYLDFYRAAATDEDAAVRGVAMMALGRHGGPTDAPLLIAGLSDPEPVVRRSAARAMQRIHNPSVIPSLLRAANESREEDPETRAAAATALGQYADGQVIQGLIAALRDRRLLVNQAARDSLILLTGQDLGVDPGAWLQWTRQSDDLFAGRGRYVYPVYRRAPFFWEQFIPWMRPPNETASVPVGMTPPTPDDPAGG